MSLNLYLHYFSLFLFRKNSSLFSVNSPIKEFTNYAFIGGDRLRGDESSLVIPIEWRVLHHTMSHLGCLMLAYSQNDDTAKLLLVVQADFRDLTLTCYFPFYNNVYLPPSPFPHSKISWVLSTGDDKAVDSVLCSSEFYVIGLQL